MILSNFIKNCPIASVWCAYKWQDDCLVIAKYKIHSTIYPYRLAWCSRASGRTVSRESWHQQLQSCSQRTAATCWPSARRGSPRCPRGGSGTCAGASGRWRPHVEATPLHPWGNWPPVSTALPDRHCCPSTAGTARKISLHPLGSTRAVKIQ